MNYLKPNILFFLIINLINLFIVECKLIKIRTISFLKFLERFSISKYFFYKCGKNVLPFRNKNLINFLIKNKKIWSEIKFKNENLTLVDLTLSHQPLCAITNLVIAKEISKINNQDLIALVNQNDLATKKIAESYGIKKFVYYPENNFIKKYLYLCKSSLILKNYKNVNHFLNYKLENIDVGRATYEHYLRHFAKKTPSKIDFLFNLILSKCLSDLNFSNKIFNNYKIKNFVTNELQFLPNRILMEKALKKNISIYAKFGGADENIGIRLYKKFTDRFSVKLKYSKELRNYLIKKHKKKLEKNIINFFSSEREIKKIGYQYKDTWKGIIKKPEKLKFKNLKEFNNYFGLNHNKKNILILPHAMADNVFMCEWNIYRTPLEWYVETLKIIKKIHNVNWIINAHPAEKLHTSKINSRSLLEKEIGKKENIILIENAHIHKLSSYISAMITCHSSAGYEYTSLGVPVITSADTRYSEFDITLAPRTKKNYKKILNNITKLKKVSRDKIFRAKLYWYLNSNICKIDHPAIPFFDAVRWYDERKFWKTMDKTTNKKNLTNVNFSKNFKIQIQNSNRHLFDTSVFDKSKKNTKIKLNDA